MSSINTSEIIPAETIFTSSPICFFISVSFDEMLDIKNSAISVPVLFFATEEFFSAIILLREIFSSVYGMSEMLISPLNFSLKAFNSSFVTK